MQYPLTIHSAEKMKPSYNGTKAKKPLSPPVQFETLSNKNYLVEAKYSQQLALDCIKDFTGWPRTPASLKSKTNLERLFAIEEAIMMWY